MGKDVKDEWCMNTRPGSRGGRRKNYSFFKVN